MGKTFLSLLRAVVAVSTTRQIESAGIPFAVKNTGFLLARFINMGCSTSKTELGTPKIDILFDKYVIT